MLSTEVRTDQPIAVRRRRNLDHGVSKAIMADAQHGALEVLLHDRKDCSYGLIELANAKCLTNLGLFANSAADFRSLKVSWKKQIMLGGIFLHHTLSQLGLDGRNKLGGIHIKPSIQEFLHDSGVALHCS